MTNRKILIVILAAILCLSLVVMTACGDPCKNGHTFVDGVCTVCEAADPNYQPPHQHNFVEGECSCGATDPNYVKPVTLADIAGSAKAGETHTFEAVVFAVDANGFYVNDTHGSIYVASTETVAVGDKVEVTGTVELQGASIKKAVINATAVTVKASGQTALAPAFKTVGDLLATTAHRKNFYQYVTIAGFVTPVEGGYILTLGEGESKLGFAADSNEFLAAFEGKQVDVTAIVTGYSGGWQLSVLSADDVALHVTDLDLVKAEIFNWVAGEVADEVYFALELPTAYALEGSVEFTWAVTSGTGITVENNVATVNATEESLVKLTLTLTSGEKTATQEYDVLVLVPPTATFAEAKAITDSHLVTITGTVLTASHSQGGGTYSVVLFNESNELIQVSVDVAKFANYSKGDVVKAVGTWTEGSYGICYFASSEAVVVTEAAADYVTNLTPYQVVTLETEADYNAFLENWTVKASAGVIVKIVNPYVIYSGNTSYNFIRFGYNTEAGSKYTYTVGEGETAVSYSRIFCFHRDALEEAIPGLDAAWEVPFLNAGAASQRTASIYAMPLYAGADTLQFSIIDPALFETDKQGMVEDAIYAAFPTNNIPAAEAGVVTLPTTAVWVDGEITWTTSAPEFIDVNTGAYVALTNNLAFTLTATYVIDGVTCTTVLNLNAVAVEAQPYTLEQAKTATAEDLLFNGIKAYIGAFATDSNSTKDNITGYYLTDGTNVLWVATSQLAVGETALALYDEVVVSQPVIEGKSLVGGTVTAILSSGNTIDYTNFTADVTITSEAELAAWAAQTTPSAGVIVKFEGPMYFVGTGSSGGSGCRWQLNYKAAAGSAAARYTFNLPTNADKTLSFKAMNGLLIDEWWAAAGMPQASGSTPFQVTGSFYCVSGTWGNTLWAFNFINADAFSLRPLTDAEKAATEVAALDETISAAAAGTYTLPTETTLAKNITWETVTTMEGLSIAEGVLSFPAVVGNDATITLKATYTVGEETFTTNVNFTLQAKVVPVTTVTETLALEDGADVKVKGIVGAFGGQGSTSASNYQSGLVLTDGTSVIVINHLGAEYLNADSVYVIGEHVLAIGDEVIVSGTLTKTAATETAFGVTTVTPSSAEFVSAGNQVSWKAADVTITSEEEMVAFATSWSIGQVVTVTGSEANVLFVRCSGSKSGEHTSWSFHYKVSESEKLADLRYTCADGAARAFAVKGGCSEYVLGDDWWTALGMDHSADKALNKNKFTGSITVVITGYGSTNIVTSAIASTLAIYTPAA